jgi:hypothetical protein
MDFGLNRFLEMFEERFGRRLTTALLALMGLAVASVSVSLIYANIALPAWQFLTALYFALKLPSSPSPNFLDLVGKVGSGVAAVLAVVLMVVRVLEYMETRRLQTILEEKKLQIVVGLAPINPPSEPPPTQAPQDTPERT